MTDSAPFRDTVLASNGAPPETIALGTMIDQYRVDAPLGVGGMGVVYRAHDTRLGRDVALKLLRDPAPGTDTCAVWCTLLANEARTMARLSHPNVVRVFDTGVHVGCVYVALELVEGETLREWCAREKPRWQERLRVLIEAADALAAAHDAGVWHRDVKPDNILVGRDGRTRLTDFGIARSAIDISDEGNALGCGCALSVADLIAATSFSGTIAYMSPQQLRGEPADARADQFSYATTCWEVLLGMHPFGGDTPMERLAAVVRDELVPPAGHEVPNAVLEVLSQALRARREDRYPSMRQVIAALRSAVDSR